MNIVPMEDLPPKSNPFHHDRYHMGQVVGTNCTIMFENHRDQPCKYLIIINTETGKRVKVMVDENASPNNLSADIINNHAKGGNIKDVLKSRSKSSTS